MRNGIPSEDTLERILKHLLPKELEQSLRACAGVVTGYLAAKHVCIDGKEHRGTVPAGARHALIQTVSVGVAEAQLSFGQVQVGAKTNKKRPFPSCSTRSTWPAAWLPSMPLPASNPW